MLYVHRGRLMSHAWRNLVGTSYFTPTNIPNHYNEVNRAQQVRQYATMASKCGTSACKDEYFNTCFAI